MKDIADIDHEANYADMVLRNGDVYNNEGLTEFVKTAGKEKVVKDLKIYDASGRLKHTKGEYIAPNFMVSDKDQRGAHIGFVPDYDVVSDEGNPLMFDWKTENGTVKAPIRKVKDYVFDALPTSAKAYILQEARKYAQAHGRNVNEKQVENLAKVIAYDEIGGSSKLSSTVSELYEAKPSTYEVKNYWNVPLSGGSGGGEKKKENQGAMWVDDAVGAMKSGDTQAITNVFSHLHGGDKGEFIDVRAKGNKVIVRYRSKDGLLGELEDKVEELNANDPYVKDKAKRLYQKIMGGDVNTERQPYYKDRNQQPTQSQPKQTQQSGGGFFSGVIKNIKGMFGGNSSNGAANPKSLREKYNY